MPDCLFCKIAHHKIPSQIVFEADEILAFEDITPQAPVHILLIPKKHFETVLDLKAEDSQLIGQLQLVAIKLAKEKGLSEKGFRLVYNCKQDGGQSVQHVHLHLLGGRKMTWPPG